MPQDTYPELPSNFFASAISKMDYGGLAHRLSEDLLTIVREVHSTGRAGGLTLKLDIKPSGDGGRVEITDDITLRRPKGQKGKSMFFATEHGQLLERDPRQKEFKFGDPQPVAVAK